MSNHKWRVGDYPQLCLRCGCIRNRKAFKYLMAITNQYPYNHYKYETKLVYTTLKETTEIRPDCKK